MEKTPIIVCVSIIGIIGIILTIILVPVSLRNVDYDEIGIQYGKLTKKINYENILEEGRYVLTPSTKVFLYKRTLQTIDFTGNETINCLTNEGLEMELGVETQFQIKSDKLFDIFDEFGEQENYVLYLKSITADAIRDVCSNYSGEDFFFNRGTIDNALSTYLIKVFEESNSHATNELVQLTSVIHPEKYDDTSKSREAIGQENDKLLREREEDITKAETDLLSAIVNSEILIIGANATRDSIILEAEALYDSEVKKWVNRADVLVNIKSGIPGISNIDFINTYIKYDILKDNKNEPIIEI